MSAAVASQPSHLDSPHSPLSPDGGNHSTRWQNAAHGSTTQLVSGQEPTQKWKGKGKEIASPNNEEEGLRLEDVGRDSVDHGDLGEEEEEEEEGTAASYPPMHDDELEERRVAENLKRWEAADRLKRKSLRESRSATSPTSPKFSSESAVRRASLLWNDATRGISLARPANQHGRRGSMGSQMPLRGEEDALSMDDRQTRTSTIGDRNPFDTPRGGSPTRAHEESGALMHSNPTTPVAGPSHQQQLEQLSSTRPILPTTESSFDGGKGRMPQPRPIDIPQAISPPPPRIAPIDVPGDPDEEEHQRGRYWTEWLCGCREEGQHGDGAAGRTNPFE